MSTTADTRAPVGCCRFQSRSSYLRGPIKPTPQALATFPKSFSDNPNWHWLTMKRMHGSPPAHTKKGALTHSPQRQYSMGTAELSMVLLASIVSLLTISRAFNSLFKVLFIFPSRYLFAIGLLPLFSLRRNLPPILSCNPKQLDSLRTSHMATRPPSRRDSHPLWCPIPGNLYDRLASDNASLDYNSGFYARF